MLLAPIARLLDITVDTLLSFNKELTDEEINNIIMEANEILQTKPYDEAFQWAEGIINQYPNNEKLIWDIAVMFDAWRLMKDIPGLEKYDDCINDYYIRALESEDEEVRTSAATSLFEFYVRKEQYDKAEELLKYFSRENPEKKRKQADIYSKTNRHQEAYKAYEELLFSGYQMLNTVLSSIYMLALREEDRDKAHYIVEKQKELTRIFEMGKYHEVSCGLELVTIEKDEEGTIETMEQIIDSLDTICDFRNSPLYEHMEFRDTGTGLIEELRKNLLICFANEETYGYMKDNSRWRKLTNK